MSDEALLIIRRLIASDAAIRVVYMLIKTDSLHTEKRSGTRSWEMSIVLQGTVWFAVTAQAYGRVLSPRGSRDHASLRKVYSFAMRLRHSADFRQRRTSTIVRIWRRISHMCLIG